MSVKDSSLTGKPPLELAIMWHMHQPDYRNIRHRRFELPWVRLHALKDYYDMPARLERFPGVRQTFNLVPSLVEQIEDYLTGEWTEVELELFFKRAETLSDQDKEAILDLFFEGPDEHLVKPYPRYAELLRLFRSKSRSEVIRDWTPADWRDLQFWRQLAWTDPLLREKDPLLLDLIGKGGGFGEELKEPLWERMKHWLSQSIQIYKRLQDEGTIEVTVTPYYHPILPLLIDPTSAREAMPGCEMPEPYGLHPQDARVQMEKAIAFYEKRFGARPRGVWPSEGSVSQEVARLFSDLKIEWFATDEDILSRSLGRPLREGKGDGDPARSDLYRPYRTLSGEGPAILFRDHRLSDLIGFEYQRWEPAQAARDFVDRLLGIRKRWKEKEPPLVSVILDGENCWEYYPEDGGPFLDALYTKLMETPEIECVKVSQALKSRTPAPLKNLSAGSWIHGNFHIWIGEEEDRRAWSLLEKARQTLVEAERDAVTDPERFREAWEDIYAAQGSDWYWWFGETHTTSRLSLFDELFRRRLIRVYELLGLEVPHELSAPIASAPSLPEMDSFFQSPPLIDGRESHYYEWKAAALFDPLRHAGAMRAIEHSGIERISYGCDRQAFYLRIDPESSLPKPIAWEIRTTFPSRVLIRFTQEGDRITALKRALDPDASAGEIELAGRHASKALAANDEIFEARLEWDILETNGAKTLSFVIGMESADGNLTRVPSHSQLGLNLPQGDRPDRYWFP